MEGRMKPEVDVLYKEEAYRFGTIWVSHEHAALHIQDLPCWDNCRDSALHAHALSVRRDPRFTQEDVALAIQDIAEQHGLSFREEGK
jgi:phage protein D